MGSRFLFGQQGRGLLTSGRGSIFDRRGALDPIVQAYDAILATDPTVPVLLQLTEYRGQQILFQDPACTIPVESPGDPIGGVRHPLTGEIIAVQTTDASRPVWGGVGVGAEFDGVDDHLLMVDEHLLTQDFQDSLIMGDSTVSVGWDFPDDPDDIGDWLSLRCNDGGDQWYLNRDSDSGDRHWLFRRPDGGDSSNRRRTLPVNMADAGWVVFGDMVDRETGGTINRSFAETYGLDFNPSTNAISGEARAVSQNFAIGAYNDNGTITNHCKGKCTGVVMWDRHVPDDEFLDVIVPALRGQDNTSFHGIEYAWSGGTTEDSAVVSARVDDDDTSDVTIAVSDDGFTTEKEFSGATTADYVRRFECAGLDHDTAYDWEVRRDGDVVHDGAFRTQPKGEASYSVALASCAGNSGAQFADVNSRTSNSPTFDFIRQRDPQFFLHMGDFHYKDIVSENPAIFRIAYQDVLENPRQSDLYANVATFYHWDDHDFGEDVSDGTSPSKPAAQQAYREIVPYRALPADSGEIYQTWTAGRVRWIALDVRSERTPNDATDDENKTMLGETQKQWLKDTLLSADEPVIVLAVSVGWITSTRSDAWAGFSTEREELAKFFEANDLTDRLLIVHGDAHMLAGDDGTNSQYDPDATGDGPPVFCAAPLDASNIVYGGPYSEGVIDDSRQQYGVIDVDDRGDEIEMTMRGFVVDTDTDTETEALTFSEVYDVT